MRKIDKHIIHCSDTADNSNITVEMIRDWHKERGWSDIGYHFVILRNGNIMKGREVEKIGAHCKGYNANSIGTCLVGRVSFNEEQFKSLQNLHRILQNTFPDITVHGHNEFNNKKTCPNFNVKKYIN